LVAASEPGGELAVTLFILAAAAVLFDAACVVVISVFVKRARPAELTEDEYILEDW
jgi:hypothetical protein